MDDSPEFLALVRDLVSERASVECFDSSDTLVDDIALFAPDLVMIDLKLDGDARGWDLLNECRTDSRFAGVSFVICSADVYGLEEHAPEISSMADVRVLRKPFDIAEFEDAIAPVVSGITTARSS